MRCYDQLGIIRERDYCWMDAELNQCFSSITIEFDGLKDISIQRFTPKASIIALIFENTDFLVKMLNILADSTKVAKIMLFAKHPANMQFWGFCPKVKSFATMDITKDDLLFIVKKVQTTAFQYCIFPSGYLKSNDNNLQQEDEFHSWSELTDREREVLLLLAEGASNKVIAETLIISENTVKTHVRRILEKLQFSSRTKAALYARNSGFIKERK